MVPELDPRPALRLNFRDKFRGPLRHQAIEQLLVGQEGLISLREQVAAYGAAGGFIGAQAHGQCAGIGARYLPGRELLAQVLRVALPMVPRLAPHLELRLVVIRNGQRLQLLERCLFLSVSLDQLRMHVGQLEALADHDLADAEVRGDIGDRLAGVYHRLEGVELVGGVHRHADGVLGGAGFDRLFVGEPAAGHAIGE